MNIIIEKDYKEMSSRAGDIFKEEIRSNPEIILCLATGSTPIGLYKELIKAHKEEGLDFSMVKTFNLDEYVGLSPDHPSSYNYFMHENLFNHINIREENISIPNGLADDMEKFCKLYDKKIEEAGGIDLLLLGIGEDGHIAFNEPDTYLKAGTNVTKLAESTIEVNSRFFESIEQVPTTAVTMGMASIMKAKKIVLLANGPRKHDVIKRLVNCETITTELPVSFLHLHRDVTVIVDEEAYYG